nr:pyridoxamine 5'-phosphate oxidase family protein [uncultured Eisenbergiella sp.]
MIKTEKTVTDLAGRLKIVDSCDMCRLGLTDGKRVSVIPVSFGYTFLNGKFTFYMKGDLDDRVMKLLREAEEIAFQMDSDHCMLPVENGEYTMFYNCAEGYGKPVFLEDTEEKKTAMKHLLAHYLPREDTATDIPWEEDCMLKLEVTKLDCKVCR